MDKSKCDYISFASVISALSVVILHTNNCFWNFSATARYWKTANVVECVFYFAVPVFFMVSGATLLDFYKRYGLREFLIRRVRKTVIPYIFWSFFGLGFQMYYLKTISAVDWKYIVNGLLSGRIVGIYWFFIPLFCVYLSIPLFAAVNGKYRKTVFIYLAVVCFLINCLIPFFNAVFHISADYTLSVAVGSGYLFYIILGYLFHTYEVCNKLKHVIFALGIVGLLAHIIGTYQLSMAEGQIVSTYKGYTNVPCTLYSVSVFLALKQAWGGKMAKKCWANRWICFLKDYTFPLYLIHWYVIQVMVKEWGINVQSIYFRLGMPFVIFPVTVFLTWLIRKIPLGRKILP